MSNMKVREIYEGAVGLMTLKNLRDNIKIFIQFFNRFMKERSIIMGTMLAFIAFMLRAVANGMMMPYILKYLVNALTSTPINYSLIDYSVTLLMVVAVIFGTTEWAFKPYWNSIARGITTIKFRLIREVKSGEIDDGDLIGKIVNDVDFIMWNFGNVIGNVVPNALTGVVAQLTIFQLNPVIGTISIFLITPYFIITEYYIKEVEKARIVERRSYSESIHNAEEYLMGRQNDPKTFIESLNRWYKGISKNILLDRIYWSSTLILSTIAPLGLTMVGLNQVIRGKMGVGSLIGIVYASFSVYSSYTNAFSGICLMGQTKVPMKRIMSLKSGESIKVTYKK